MQKAKIDKRLFTHYLKQGYGVQAIACALGVTRITLNAWAKSEFGKTVLELRKEVK